MSNAFCRPVYSGIESIQSVPVYHCPDAWALLVHAVESPECGSSQAGATCRRSMGLVYSGDTRPCAELVRAATTSGDRRRRSGCPPLILIHEATFWSAEQQHARQKRHSVRTQAAFDGKVICCHCIERV